MSTASSHNGLLSSLIEDVESYSGQDPLVPWLRGIKKMKTTLPSELLKENLPRFLQKCVQTFCSEKRYRNDIRYLRVWFQLMDYVKPKAILRIMEANCIGMKCSLYYQAWALYYEKSKKFEEAEKMYYIGVQRLAEPVDALHESYEQFLNRMKKHNKKIQEIVGMQKHTDSQTAEVSHSVSTADIHTTSPPECTTHNGIMCGTDSALEIRNMKSDGDGEESANVKLMGAALLNKSEKEDAISDVSDGSFGMGFHGKASKMHTAEQRRGFDDDESKLFEHEETFETFNGSEDERYDGEDKEQCKLSVQDRDQCSLVNDDFLFPLAMSDGDAGSSLHDVVKEDCVHCFIGSAVLDNPAVEQFCHNGLVDPTINLKEAMDDINDMFGKPTAAEGKLNEHQVTNIRKKQEPSGFWILPDDDSESQCDPGQPHPAEASEDFLEPTICTREAMDDINKMFGMPLGS